MTGPADAIPPEIAARDQWIAWRNECREGCGVFEPEIKECPECGEKTTKRPLDPETGGFARTNDPETWGSIEEAQGHYESTDAHGIGFVFSEDDQLVGIDLDDCRDPETGELEGWARDIVRHMASFTEVSPSGTGLHIYAFGELPEGGNRHDGVEMYETERYFTVTGDSIPQAPDAINFRSDEIEEVHSGYVEGHGSGIEVEDVDIDFSFNDSDLPDTYENGLGWSLEEVRERDAKLDSLLKGTESGYDSTSEADMATASKLWFWRFNATEIAQIIRRHRPRPKVIDRIDYLELTISKAVGGEQYDPRHPNIDDVEILEDREEYHSITEADLPEDRNFVLDKPPREGGSHASMDHLTREGKDFVGLVSRHAIAEHHLGILEDVMPDGWAAVHLEGRSRACDHGGQCPKSDMADMTYQNTVKHEVKEAIHTKRTITADDAPDNICKYDFIREAAEQADAVVTVPQLLSEIEVVPDETNLLIDEEQALSYFRPDSTNLVNVSQQYEPDGTRSVQVSSSNINDQWDALESIRESVYEDQKQRKEDNDGTFQRTQVEIDLVNAIDYLEEIKDTLAVSEIYDELLQGEGSATIKDVIDELIERISDIDSPIPRLSPNDFRDRVEDYIAEYYYSETVSPGELIEAALFQYEDKPFDFKKAGGSFKIRMIAGRDVFSRDEIDKFDQIGVIAGPEGELFFKDLGMDAVTIKITSFVYDEDFIVVPVARESEEGEPESPKRQRGRARRVSKILNRRSHPHLAVAGTKERAKAHHSSLGAGPADIISSPESPALDTYRTWTIGGSAIIYENSAVSRGIDAPFFDISVVVSSGFATPYWEARRKYHRENDEDEEYKYASAVEEQIKSRELTNAVLRPASTRNIDDEMGTKFIVCADWDTPRLHYLEDRTIPPVGDAEKAANIVEQLTISGGIQEETDRVYDWLDGNERAFIETAVEAEFKETKLDRPHFSLGEVTKWRENWWITGGETVDRVEKAVPLPGDEVTKTHIRNLLDPWAGGRINAGLTVLERMGLIRSFTKEREEDGQEVIYYERDIDEDAL